MALLEILFLCGSADTSNPKTKKQPEGCFFGYKGTKPVFFYCASRHINLHRQGTSYTAQILSLSHWQSLHQRYLLQAHQKYRKSS